MKKAVDSEARPCVLRSRTEILATARRAYDAGRVFPLLEVCDVLATSQDVPEWFVEAVRDLVQQRILRIYPSEKGSVGGELNRIKKDLQHLKRWRVVEQERKQWGISRGLIRASAILREQGEHVHEVAAVAYSFRLVEKSRKSGEYRFFHPRYSRVAKALGFFD